MDSRGGSQNCESVIPFTLGKPRYDNSESDSTYIYRRKVRPTGPRLLHLFPLTPADESSKKKRCFGQARAPLSEHDPANIPGNCDSVIPFSLERASYDCGSDTNRLRVRPLLLCMFPLTPAGEPSLTKSFFGKEGLQMSEADPGTRPGKDVINRSENELGSPYQDLRPLSSSTYPAQPSLLEDTPENPLRRPEVELPFLSSEVQSETFIDSSKSSSEQFVDPSAISPRVTDQPLEVPREVPLATNLSNGGEVIAFEPEPTNLWNGRDDVAPFKPESTTLTNGASNGSGFPLSSRALVPNGAHLMRKWGASQLRTAIGAESVGVVSNNNSRLLQGPPAQRTQPQAQSPSQSRPQPPAQPPAQPRAQPRVQPLAQPRAQQRVQPPAQPQTQQRVQPPAQPRAQKRVQPPTQPRAQPRVKPPAQPRAQLRFQPPAQARAQPRVQPAAQAGVQHGPRPKSSPFKGVTHYKRTGRWEAHIWKNKDDRSKGKQIYLGASSTPNQAARAYDRAAIHFRGVNAEINFLLSDYHRELPQLQAITRKQLVDMLRKQSAGKGTVHPEYPSP